MNLPFVVIVRSKPAESDKRRYDTATEHAATLRWFSGRLESVPQLADVRRAGLAASADQKIGEDALFLRFGDNGCESGIPRP